MKVQMHSIRFDADVKLTNFIQRKLDKLETFYNRIVDAEVFMRLDSDHANENKIIEIKINLPGEQLFSKYKSNTFESATDHAVEALRRQLKKHKEKLISH